MSIEEYLNALCASLKVDPLRRDEIRLEVHTHLRQRADAWKTGGLDSEAAEQRAIDEFGGPEEMGPRLSQESPRMTLLNPTTRQVQWAGMCLFAFSILLSLLVIRDWYETYTHGWLFSLHRGRLDFLLLSFCHRLWLPLLLLSLQMLLGLALSKRKRWARFPAGGVSIFHILAFLWVFYVWILGPTNYGRATLLMMGMLPSLAIGTYTLWSVSTPRHRQIEWT